MNSSSIFSIDTCGDRSVDPGVGGPDPRKYVGGGSVCFDSLKCHTLSFKSVVG